MIVAIDGDYRCSHQFAAGGIGVGRQFLIAVRGQLNHASVVCDGLPLVVDLV
jgi:hypothetical protein